MALDDDWHDKLIHQFTFVHVRIRHNNFARLVVDEFLLAADVVIAFFNIGNGSQNKRARGRGGRGNVAFVKRGETSIGICCLVDICIRGRGGHRRW